MTEVFAVFLVCFWFWGWAELIAAARFHWGWCVVSAVALAWLCLTRVVFGYVLAAGIFCLIYLTVLLRRRREPGRLLASCALALLLCLPWLLHTHARTGRPFYWSTAGGLSLYWMSSPVEGEHGDWVSVRDALSNARRAEHHPLLRQAAALDEPAQDALLRRAAFENIRRHPARYAKNVAANVSRLFFSFPYTRTPQKLTTLFYIVPNALLLSALAAALAAMLRTPRASVAATYPYALFAGLAFLGSALLSAYARMLFPIVPFILFFIVFGLRGMRWRLAAEAGPT